MRTQPFLREEEAGAEGAPSRTQPVTRTLLPPPGKLARLPQRGPSVQPRAGSGHSNRVAWLSPELLPGNTQPSAGYGSCSLVLLTLLFLTGGAGADGRGLKGTRERLFSLISFFG